MQVKLDVQRRLGDELVGSASVPTARPLQT
jgi:hypothetical protein